MVHRLGPAGNLSFPFHVRENWASPLHAAGEAPAAAALPGCCMPQTAAGIVGRRGDAARTPAGTDTRPAIALHCAAFGWPAVIDRQGVFRRDDGAGEAPPVVLQYSSTPQAAEVRCWAAVAPPWARPSWRLLWGSVGAAAAELCGMQAAPPLFLPSPLQIFLSMYPLGPAPRAADIRWEGPSCTGEGVLLDRCVAVRL